MSGKKETAEGERKRKSKGTIPNQGKRIFADVSSRTVELDPCTNVATLANRNNMNRTPTTRSMGRDRMTIAKDKGKWNNYPGGKEGYDQDLTLAAPSLRELVGKEYDDKHLSKGETGQKISAERAWMTMVGIVSTPATKDEDLVFQGFEECLDPACEGGGWKFNYGGLLNTLPTSNFISDDVDDQVKEVIKYIFRRPKKHCVKAATGEQFTSRGHNHCLCFVNLKEVLTVFCPTAYDEVNDQFYPNRVPNIIVRFFEPMVRMMLGVKTMGEHAKNDDARRVAKDLLVRFILQHAMVRPNPAATGNSSYIFQFPFHQKNIGNFLGEVQCCKGMLVELVGCRRGEGIRCNVNGANFFNALFNFRRSVYNDTDIDKLSLLGRKRMLAVPGHRTNTFQKIALTAWHAEISSRHPVLQCMIEAKIYTGDTEMDRAVNKVWARKIFKEKYRNYLPSSLFEARFETIRGAIVSSSCGEKAYVIAAHNAVYPVDEAVLNRRPALKELLKSVATVFPPLTKDEKKRPLGNVKVKEPTGTQDMAQVREYNRELFAKSLGSVKDELVDVQHLDVEVAKAPALSRREHIYVPALETNDDCKTLHGVPFACLGQTLWKTPSVLIDHDFDCCVLEVPKSMPLDTICNEMLADSVGPKCLIDRGFLRLNGNDNLFYDPKGRSIDEYLQYRAGGMDAATLQTTGKELLSSIVKWARLHSKPAPDGLFEEPDIQVYEHCLVPDFTKQTFEVARTEVPWSVLVNERDKGNRVAVAVIPVAPQGHLRRLFPGPYVLTDAEMKESHPWKDKPKGVTSSWIGSLVHIQYKSFLVGPATMLVSEGFHVCSGITPYLVVLAAFGKDASTVHRERLTLDCYFGPHGPRSASEVEKSKVFKMATMGQNTTFKEKGNMTLPSVISLTPTPPSPLHHQLSLYYANKFGPTLSFGNLENLAARPYQEESTSSAEEVISSVVQQVERDLDIPPCFAKRPISKGDLPEEPESDEESASALEIVEAAAEPASDNVAGTHGLL